MKKIIFTMLFISSLAVIGQEDKGTFTVSGIVDTYGTTNFDDAAGTPGILIANPQNAAGFGLGSANTIFSYEKGKTGVVVDLAFGPRADDANLAGAINQLYAYYNVSDKVTITAGQFNTFLGYEVISPAANFNYTVSYLFNAGPFSHTGIKVNYAASEDLSLMLAVTNAHAISSADGNVTGDTQIGAQVGYKGQFLNLIYGAQDATSAEDYIFLDYTGGFDLTESLYLGINAAYVNSSKDDAGYSGAALYIQNSFSETFALGLRPEIYNTKSAGTDSSLFALTLTSNMALTDNLKFITDLRFDSSKDGIIEAFPTKDNVTSLTLAAVYSF